MIDHCQDVDHFQYHLVIDHCQDVDHSQYHLVIDHCQDVDHSQYHFVIYHCQDVAHSQKLAFGNKIKVGNYYSALSVSTSVLYSNCNKISSYVIEDRFCKHVTLKTKKTKRNVH